MCREWIECDKMTRFITFFNIKFFYKASKIQAKFDKNS